jgi:hypothetical protein
VVEEGLIVGVVVEGLKMRGAVGGLISMGWAGAEALRTKVVVEGLLIRVEVVEGLISAG